MENEGQNLDKNDSNSDDTPSENILSAEQFLQNLENLGISQTNELVRQQKLLEKMEKIKRALDESQKNLESLKKIMSNHNFPIQSSDSQFLAPSIPDSLHEKSSKAESSCTSKTTSSISEPSRVIHDRTTKSFKRDPIDDSIEETTDIELIIDDEDLRLEIESETSESEKKYRGKGKEAANPKFRYKKQSKPEISTTKMQSQKTPSKDFKVKFGSSQSKGFKSQSPKAESTRISPAVKRKELDSDETSDGTSKMTRHHLHDSDEARKKLKFDQERESKQCPLVSQLLETSSNLEGFIAQSDSESNQNKNEQLSLPTSSGLENVINYAASTEDSTDFNGSEAIFPSEKDESSVTSESEYLQLTELGESALAGDGKDFLLSEIEDSSVASFGTDILLSERDESSSTSVSNGVPQRDKGESPLAGNYTDVPLGERQESSFRNMDPDISLYDKEASLESIATDVPMDERESSLEGVCPDVPLNERGESSFRRTDSDSLLYEKGESSFESMCSDGPSRERRVTSFPRISHDVPLLHRREQSVVNISPNAPLGERGDTSLTSISIDLQPSESAESSLMNVRTNKPFIEKAESLLSSEDSLE